VQSPVTYPVDRSIDDPDHPLNRLTTAFRIFTVTPIAIVYGLVNGAGAYNSANNTAQSGAGSSATAGGRVIAAAVLMLPFRRMYPRWWFDWNVGLTNCSARPSSKPLPGRWLSPNINRSTKPDQAQRRSGRRARYGQLVNGDG
jgi:hypothetical protein